MDQLEADGIVRRSYLSEIENGQATPSSDMLVAIVTRLGGNVKFFTDHLRALHIADRERRQNAEPRWSNPNLAALDKREHEPAEDRSLPDQPTLVVTNKQERRELYGAAFPESLDELDFNLPLELVHADDSYEIDKHGLVRTSIYRRTIRAEGSGLQVYRWWFRENPAMLTVKRIDLGVSAGGTITKVWRLSTLAYGVELTLDAPLDTGQEAQLQYYKVIDAMGVGDPYVQTDETTPCHDQRISVKFDGAKPETVWYWRNMPARAAPSLYSERFRLEEQITGQFEKDFERIKPGLSSGIAWQFAEGQARPGPEDTPLSRERGGRGHAS
jgi:transcriptional regulator with XRE-family HTH domain